MRLDVGVLGSEQLLGPFTRELFDAERRDSGMGRMRVLLGS